MNKEKERIQIVMFYLKTYTKRKGGNNKSDRESKRKRDIHLFTAPQFGMSVHLICLRKSQQHLEREIFKTM